MARNLYQDVKRKQRRKPPVLALRKFGFVALGLFFIIQGLDLCAAGHTLKWVTVLSVGGKTEIWGSRKGSVLTLT